MSTRTACVYRAYDAEGVLLYVGQSMNPKRRMGDHRSKPWAPLVDKWVVSDPMPVGDALDAESAAILSERPLYNIAGTSIDAAYARWLADAPETALAALHAIGRHHLDIAFKRMFSEDSLPDTETFIQNVRAAIELAQADDPSITAEDIRWAVTNWFGPPSLHQS